MPRPNRHELALARAEDPDRFEIDVERYHQRALNQSFSTPLVYAAFQRRSSDSYFRIAAWLEVERRLGGKPTEFESEPDEVEALSILDDVKRFTRWARARLKPLLMKPGD